METNFAVAIDFDGTITEVDITTSLIREFAKPGWEEAERLWEAGVMGSRDCLKAQISLVDVHLVKLVAYVRKFSINAGFVPFLDFLKESHVPFGIVSDGFDVILKTLLAHAGIHDIPVYANRLREVAGRLEPSFPYASKECPAGMCKCKAAGLIGKGLPVIHIGDGRSDFCLAEEAMYVFSTGKLTEVCKAKGIPHQPFTDFESVAEGIQLFLHHPLVPLQRQAKRQNKLRGKAGYGI